MGTQLRGGQGHGSPLHGCYNTTHMLTSHGRNILLYMVLKSQLESNCQYQLEVARVATIINNVRVPADPISSTDAMSNVQFGLEPSCVMHAIICLASGVVRSSLVSSKINHHIQCLLWCLVNILKSFQQILIK